MKKIFALNCGSRTRRALGEGISKAQLVPLRTKELMMHIKKDLTISLFHRNERIDFTDSVVFTRLRANDAHFCGILYEHFEALSIPASDPINRSFKLSEEKISQMPRLARAKIRIPETIIAQEESYRANRDYIVNNISFPLVFKTDGSQGKAVFKIDTQAELDEKIANKHKYELFILQELIPNTFDTRTLVAFGTILGSIKRSAQNGNFLNNVAQGGLASEYQLTEEEKAIAITACDVNSIDFGGVDIIHTESGPVVLEVNKAPQITGFESIHGENFVFKTIAQKLENQLP